MDVFILFFFLLKIKDDTQCRKKRTLFVFRHATTTKDKKYRVVLRIKLSMSQFCIRPRFRGEQIH